MKIELTRTDDIDSLDTLLRENLATFRGINVPLKFRQKVGIQLTTALKVFKFKKIITSYLRGDITNSTTHFGFALDIKGDIEADPHKMRISPAYTMRPKLIQWLLDKRSVFNDLRIVVLLEENHIHFHSREVEHYRPELSNLDTLSYKPEFFPSYRRTPAEKQLIERIGYQTIKPLTQAVQLDIFPRNFNQL